MATVLPQVADFLCSCALFNMACSRRSATSSEINKNAGLSMNYTSKKYSQLPGQISEHRLVVVSGINFYCAHTPGRCMSLISYEWHFTLCFTLAVIQGTIHYIRLILNGTMSELKNPVTLAYIIKYTATHLAIWTVRALAKRLHYKR